MTIKVMLVDDEILVRLGIKSLIDWEQHGFSYIGDAPDGKKAMEAMEQTVPDILLTDILMPQMNGLELIEAVRKRFPHTRIIVLSSHDEYEYVRKAMKLGVDDYILKASMKPDELLELLLETAGKIEARYEDVKQLLVPGETESKGPSLAEWLRTQLEIADSNKDNEVKATEKRTDMHCPITLGDQNVLIVLNIHRSPTVSLEDSSLLQTIMNLIELELNKWLPGYPVHYKEKQIVLLIPFPKDLQQGLIHTDVKTMSQDLISAVKRFLGVSLSAGLSLPFQGQAALHLAYQQALQAVELYYYEGREKAYRYSSSSDRQTGFVSFSQETEKNLRHSLEAIDGDRIRLTLNELFDQLQEVRGPKEHSIQFCLQLLHVIQTAWKPYGEDGFEGLEGPLYKQVLAFDELEDARHWFIRLIEAGLERIQRTRREPYHEEIRKLIQYMREHFIEDLSLKEAAEMVNMNETYLSYLFKKETQTGFTEYLNQLRLDKASEYLAETNLPSYLIAEKVGYANINYFGRIFKKMIGLSPQQYRAKFQNQKK
ncbi:response regulator [Paenibacillus sp. RC67]|uniref:response regulator n=1 Tax=Paenibacillus sp. RC67 TaxID=3039392 RepID=UPI0024AD3FC5|nr:response regulator [Paenibacillus sp. RC67]